MSDNELRIDIKADTTGLVGGVKKASDALDKAAKDSEKASNAMSSDVKKVADSYDQAAKSAKDSSKKFVGGVKKSGDALKQVGDEAKKAGDKLDDFGDDAAGAGKKGGDAGDKLGASFANVTATMKKMKGPARAVVAALGATALAFSQAAKRAKELNKILLTAQRTGLNPQTFQKLTVAAKKFGAEGDTVADAMKDLSERIADAAANGGSYEEALNRLGMTGKDLIGLNMEEQFLRVGGAIGKLETQADKAFISMELMADGGYQLVNMFDAGEDGMRRMANEADRLGAVLDSKSLKNVAELTSSYDNMTTAMQGAADQMVADLSPALSDVADIITDVILGMRGITEESAAAKAKMQALGDQFRTARDNLAALAIAQREMNAATKAGNIAAYDAGVEKLQTTIAALIKNYEEMSAAGQTMVDLDVVQQRMTRSAKRGSEAQYKYTTAMSTFAKQLEAVGITGDDFAEVIERQHKGLTLQSVSINGVIAALQKLSEVQDEQANKDPAKKPSVSPFPDGVQRILDDLALVDQTEQELLDSRYQRLETHRQRLVDFNEQHKEQTGEYNEELLQQEMELSEAQVAINAKKNAAVRRDEEAANKARIAMQQRTAFALGGIFGNISAMMNKESRTQFEIAKHASSAQALVNAFGAANVAMNSSGIPYPLNVIAAATTMGAGLANVAAIQSTSFGSGSSGGGASAPPTTLDAGAGAEPARDVTQFDINLQGQSIYGPEQIDSLIGAINDRTDDNVELRANVS